MVTAGRRVKTTRQVRVEPRAGRSLLAVLAKLKPLDEDFPPVVRTAAEPVEL